MHGKDVPVLLLYNVFDAGISTQYEPPGSPASAHGITLMREHGVDMASHHSAVLSQTDLLGATHVYCMTPRHCEAVRSLQSKQQELLTQPSLKGTGTIKNKPQALVSTFTPEIPDPWHGTMECFRECSEMLERAVTKALEENTSTPE